MVLRTVTFIELLMVKVIQLWMDLTTVIFHPIMDGQSHPILDGFNNCYIHPIMDGQSHPIMEVNDCHPKVDGQFLPLFIGRSVLL